MYLELDDIISRLPKDFLVEALDDNNDGVIDDEVWAALVQDVQEMIDGYLGQRFQVPFSHPLPPLVQEASKLFALELIYLRRGYHTDQDNPWAEQARKMRDKLTRIANSDEPLQPSKSNGGKSNIQVITEPSRTSSSSGRLST